MDYFPGASKKLARLRCVLTSIDCLRDGKALPDALCYFPSVVDYTVDWKALQQLSKSKEPNTPKGLDIYAYPSLSSEKLLTVDFPTDPRPDWIHLRCEGQWSSNEEGDWLKFIQLKVDGKTELDRGYLLLCKKTEFLLRPLSRANAKTLYHGALGVDCRMARWINVVEIHYGLPVSRPYLMAKIPPPVESMVERLKNPPDAHWSLKHDAQLLKFVNSNNPSEVVSSASLGCLTPYVDRLEVSSSTEGDGDDLSTNDLVAVALGDNDPSTYWESDGSPETHYIRLYMKPGVIIDKLTINVDKADESYMPSRVLVSAGDTLAELDVVSDVVVDRCATGDVCILEGQSEYHKIVAIEIPECRDDGIDVRIHGIKIKARPRHKGVNEIRAAFSNAKRLANFHLLANYNSETLRYRYLVLDRFLSLVDSVLPDIFPPAAENFRTFERLAEIRCLLPASRKAAMMFETFLKKSETKVDDIPVPKLIIDRRSAAEVRESLTEGVAMTDSLAAKTVFSQVFRSLQRYNKDASRLNKLTYRFPRNWLQWWEFKFIGEGVIDQGGPFRDVLCDITDELCPLDPNLKPTLPHFVRVENHFDEGVSGSDGFVPNPLCTAFGQYEFIGTLMGACIRSQEHLVLSLVPFVWKKLLGETTSWDDYATVDGGCVQHLQLVSCMTEEEFNGYFDEDAENNFVCASLSGNVVPVCSEGETMPVSHANRLHYVELVKRVKMGEFDAQIGAIRRGLLTVIPQPALNLITWQQLEEKVCGNPTVSVEELKKHVKFDGINKDDKRVAMLWEALENFTNEERSKFLRFVTGRRRLPTYINLCQEKSDNAKDTLPESSTCSNALYLPEYSSVKTLEEKLRYAIYNCIAIDTDTSPWD